MVYTSYHEVNYTRLLHIEFSLPSNWPDSLVHLTKHSRARKGRFHSLPIPSCTWNAQLHLRAQQHEMQGMHYLRALRTSLTNCRQAVGYSDKGFLESSSVRHCCITIKTCKAKEQHAHDHVCNTCTHTSIHTRIMQSHYLASTHTCTHTVMCLGPCLPLLLPHHTLILQITFHSHYWHWALQWIVESFISMHAFLHACACTCASVCVSFSIYLCV